MREPGTLSGPAAQGEPRAAGTARGRTLQRRNARLRTTEPVRGRVSLGARVPSAFSREWLSVTRRSERRTSRARTRAGQPGDEPRIGDDLLGVGVSSTAPERVGEERTVGAVEQAPEVGSVGCVGCVVLRWHLSAPARFFTRISAAVSARASPSAGVSRGHRLDQLRQRTARPGKMRVHGERSVSLRSALMIARTACTTTCGWPRKRSWTK